MMVEQILAELDAVVAEPKLVAVAEQQRQAVAAAGPEADIVAEYGAGGGQDDDELDVEQAGRAGENRSEHQRGLARQRNSRAFQRDDAEDGEIAVLRDQGLYRFYEHQAFRWRRGRLKPGAGRRGGE